MGPLPTFLSVAHLLGLALGLGAATVKLTLVLRCRTDLSFVPVYLQVTKTITRQIVIGIIILALSGVGWLFIGYEFSTLLIVKIILVVIMFVIGPVIDNVVEPKFRKLAPASNELPSPGFRKAQRQLLALEVTATALFYVIFAFGVLL